MEGERMAEQLPPVPLPGTIPAGRALMPEELAEFKAKGREWSRLYKEKRRKEFSAEQVEERKMKNRLRQKRFRERQKTREQEEAARLAASLHHQQLGEQHPHQQLAEQHEQHQEHHQPHQHEQHHQPAEFHHQHPQAGFDPNEPLQYGEPAHIPPPEKVEEHPEANLQMEAVPTETLIEKRKRLGRERQARFREKKRMRAQTGGGGDSSQAGMSSGAGQPQHEMMTLTELQKTSAQLSGYYTGLTQGLSREEHQAVMRFFLDGIREELGDEVFSFGGACYLPFADAAQAHAAAQVQAQYMAAGQPGLADLHTLQAVAAAHMPHGDMQAHMQAHPGAHVDSAAHLGQAHMQSHMDHQAHLAAQDAANQAAAAGEMPQEQMEAYHRQLAEHQAAHQAGMQAGQDDAFEAREATTDEQNPVTDEAQSQHVPDGSHHAEPQSMLFSDQPGGPQDMLQPENGMHSVYPGSEQT